MEAYRIKFTLPNGDITVRDLAFSQTIETISALSQEDRDRFWGRPGIEREEVELPLSNERQRPWRGCRALFIKEV
jgi:hypothetical protein